MNKRCVAALGLLSIADITMALTTELKLEGSIVPSSCVLNLHAGGVYTYGDIANTRLAPDRSSWLYTLRQNLLISCTGPTVATLKFIDNRSASQTPDPAWAPGELFGLGVDQAGNPIGGYYFFPVEVALDGVAAHYLTSTDNGLTWTQAFGGSLVRSLPDYRAAWTSPGSFVPKAFTEMTGRLDLTAYITATNNLDMTRPIELDGSATLELIYL